MTKRAGKAVAVRRDPTEKEAEAIAAARAAKAERKERIRPPSPKVIYAGPNSLQMEAPHSDALGWGTQMMEALGVDSYAVVERLMVGAGQVGPQKQVTSQQEAEAAQRRSDNALSFIAAVEPKSTLEATLALQMLASHEAGMKMSAHMHNATTRDALADYARLMNQCQRTFAAQIEALSKLRTGGKQQVEVRYVYVDARTQTVVNTGGEAGGAQPFVRHPHAPGALGHAPASGLPVWGSDAERNALPVSSDQGQEAVSDARGEQPRCTSGSGQRKLHLRALDGGGQDKTGRADGASPKLQGNAA